MSSPLRSAFWENFLGQSPVWYKELIIGLLILNPVLLLLAGGTVAGWVLILEFIFTLAMALRCYPLQPGGLLALEAVLLGLTNPDTVRHEIINNFSVILLLIFMIAGIYFLRDLLLFIFTKIFLGIRSRVLLKLLFTFLSALLSAFLDALTVMAVIITVGAGFYRLYHQAISDTSDESYQVAKDALVKPEMRADLEQFRAFLRNLLLHAAVGTALGGVCTTVGEPQNLLIATRANWEFIEFFLRMAPVAVPVLIAGLLTCVLLERLGWFQYGETLPDSVRNILEKLNEEESAKRTPKQVAMLWVQSFSMVCLVLGLAFHVAEVGLIGLMIIVLQTALGGTIDEHKIGESFKEALPFTALLVVFFVIVSVIEDQHLFVPVISWVLQMAPEVQPTIFYLANGILSIVSDNVFVATVYINEVKDAFDRGEISRALFENLAVAINTGTNIPSVATPNGQAAFLFLLTSSTAPLIGLSYGRMVLMALPYTVVMSIVGLAAIRLFI